MVLPVYTFLFADLCDYTEWTWINGDEWSAEVAVGFQELCMDLAAEESCEFVKSSGDAVMLRAADGERALRLARRIHAASAERAYPQGPNRNRHRPGRAARRRLVRHDRQHGRACLERGRPRRS